MSLLSTDITKVKRLSLREVKLPAPEVRLDSITPILVEVPPTDEDLVYSDMIVKNPLLKALTDVLGLVSEATGKRLREIGETAEKRLQIAPKGISIKDIAQEVLQGENSYTKEEIIVRLQDETKVDRTRAEKGFNLMLQAGAVEPTLGDSYYLTGSTPF